MWKPFRSMVKPLRFSISFAAVLCTLPLVAEEAAPYRAKLANSKNGEHHDFPMGVLAATGRLVDGDREILVMDVGKGGAAEKGGLKVGDRIESIEGTKSKAFSKKTDEGVCGPQLILAAALDKACSAPPHELAVTVRRENKAVELKLPVPPGPAFADSFPVNCEKTAKLRKGISARLLATQRKDGSWRPGVGGDADVYMSAFCGLALLAEDKKEHLPVIKRAIEFLNANRLPVSRINTLSMNEERDRDSSGSSSVYNSQLQLLFYSQPL